MNADSPPVTTSLGFDIKDKASKLRRNAGGPPPVRQHPARILVVDNDPALRRLLSIRLGAANYEADVYLNGRLLGEHRGGGKEGCEGQSHGHAD